MNVLTAEYQAVAVELQAAGLGATTNPGDVLTWVTQHGLCALVLPAQEYAPSMGGVLMNVPVWLITAGPYDTAAAERLDEALLLALPVVLPTQPVLRDTYEASDTDMPSLIVLAPRIVCP